MAEERVGTRRAAIELAIRHTRKRGRRTGFVTALAIVGQVGFLLAGTLTGPALSSDTVRNQHQRESREAAKIDRPEAGGKGLVARQGSRPARAVSGSAGSRAAARRCRALTTAGRRATIAATAIGAARSRTRAASM